MAPDHDEVAAALRTSVGMLLRRLRQVRSETDLTMPESSALARLDRGGPATPSELARAEEISPQSMGTTLRALEERGLVERHHDPADGRRVVMSITGAGLVRLRDKRSERTARIATALRETFTPAEVATLEAAAPLIERLAQAI